MIATDSIRVQRCCGECSGSGVVLYRRGAELVECASCDGRGVLGQDVLALVAYLGGAPDLRGLLCRALDRAADLRLEAGELAVAGHLMDAALVESTRAGMLIFAAALEQLLARPGSLPAGTERMKAWRGR
jgi:hypothetical protein